MSSFIKKYRPFIFFASLVLLVIALSVTSVYFYRKAHRLNANSSQEVRALVREVGRIMVLSDDEVPTIATVSDPVALRDQEFFAGAKQGDKVLIYTGAKKAILYDPKAKKIVNVAPINIGAGNDSPTLP